MLVAIRLLPTPPFTSALECATPYKVAEILLADHPALIAKIKAEKVIEHSKLPIIPL